MPEDITATNVIEAKKPLESCIVAWQEIAKWRNDPQQHIAEAKELANLSLLNQPFPMSIANSLNAKIEAYIEQGLLETIRQNDGDPIIHHRTLISLLARSTVSTLRLHLLAAQVRGNGQGTKT